MRAKPGDAKVCGRCNGTGTRIFKVGNYNYSAPCNEAVNPSLPIDPDLAEVSCSRCFTPTVSANLSDCLICEEVNNACPDCITAHAKTHTKVEEAAAYAALCGAERN